MKLPILIVPIFISVINLISFVNAATAQDSVHVSKKKDFFTGEYDGYALVPYHGPIKQGPYISFYRNGNVELIGQYECDLEQGIWLEYNTVGKLVEVFQYNKGEATGQQIIFLPDGRVSISGQTVNNGKIGEWIEFDSTYATFKFGKYVPDSIVTHNGDTTITEYMSKRVGIWKTYSINGNQIKSELHSNPAFK